MVDRDAVVAHVQAVASDFHDQDLVDVLPEIIDAVIAHGGTPVATDGGASLRWPLNGPPVPVLLMYLNEYSCLELNLYRQGANAAIAADLERRLVRALPQKGGTLGQRPNFAVEALTLPDSRVALAEIFQWLGKQSRTSATDAAAGNPPHRSTATGPELSVLGTHYRDFWTQFLQRVHADHPDWTGPRTPRPDNWIHLPTGIGTVMYGVNFGRRGLSSELYFDAGADLNMARFTALQAHRAELEATYGAALTWESLPGRKATRIADYTPGTVEQVDAWPEYINWFIDTQARLRAALNNRGGLATLLSNIK